MLQRIVGVKSGLVPITVRILDESPLGPNILVIRGGLASIKGSSEIYLFLANGILSFPRLGRCFSLKHSPFLRASRFRQKRFGY